MKRPENSSNREEEGKDTIEADHLQISEVATATLLQDKLEEIADCREFTRYFTLTLLKYT